MYRSILQKCRTLAGMSGVAYSSANLFVVDEFCSSGPCPPSRFSQSMLNVAPGIARFDAYVNARDSTGASHIMTSSSVLPDGRIWFMTAMLDNHHGAHTTSILAREFVPAVIGAIADLFSRSNGSPSFRTIDEPVPGDPSDEEIDEALIESFLTLDDAIVNLSAMLAASNRFRRQKNGLPEQVPILQPALTGSSGLVTFLDSSTRVLHVASTGNIRAIYGRKTSKGFDVQVLGVTENRKDVEKLLAEHPGELALVNEKGSLFDGVSPLRIFGLAPFKWTKEVSDKVGLRGFRYNGLAAGKVLTPPYLTAEPIISTLPVQEGDILVVASSRLFASDKEVLPEEIIGIIGKALNGKNRPSRWRATQSLDIDSNVHDALKLAGRAINASFGIFDSNTKDWQSRFVSNDTDEWFEERNTATILVNELHEKKRIKEELDEGEALAVAVMVFGK